MYNTVDMRARTCFSPSGRSVSCVTKSSSTARANDAFMCRRDRQRSTRTSSRKRGNEQFKIFSEIENIVLHNREEVYDRKIKND